MSRKIRSWRIHQRSNADLADLAEWINPIVRGWINYYGRFNKSRLQRLLQRINTYIVRWARNKYKRLRSFKKAKKWWRGLVDREPGLFTHWSPGSEDQMRRAVQRETVKRGSVRGQG
ncbi:group II intron maturase-specific domain-containing protein [Kibdelosporangium philippinense]|uniref:group II intron maturase-specific domain-containing protein n=1 Tax=Kibdelosporangium philippinense TaxID=211113 RepID=UPI003558A11C